MNNAYAKTQAKSELEALYQRSMLVAEIELSLLPVFSVLFPSAMGPTNFPKWLHVLASPYSRSGGATDTLRGIEMQQDESFNEEPEKAKGHGLGGHGHGPGHGHFDGQETHREVAQWHKKVSRPWPHRCRNAAKPLH